MPHRAAVVTQDCRQRRDGFFLAVDHLAGGAILDDLGDRPAAERQPRGAARPGFDHYESKRFRPVHREQQSARLAQEFCFLTLVDLPDELKVRPNISTGSSWRDTNTIGLGLALASTALDHVVRGRAYLRGRATR